jgi:hypothetical protein
MRLGGLGLARPLASTPGEIVRSLLAMQAQEHRYARWSIAQRATRTLAGVDVDAAFDQGDLLRTHVLRPTWHYVAPDDLRWLLELSGPLVLARMGRRHEELELDTRTRARSVDLLAAAVAEGPRTRHELGETLEAAGISAREQRLPHLLMIAELERAICSGPMRGRQHTYAAFDDRVPPGGSRGRDDALAQLASRYFGTRGPATARDFRWWAGLSAADGRRAIDGAALTSFEVDGRTYWQGDVHPSRLPARAELLQCYDEIVVSYTESRDVLGGGAEVLAGRTDDGFLHPVLHCGRVAGRWRVGRDGAVAVRVEPGVPIDGAVARYERFANA